MIKLGDAYFDEASIVMIKPGNTYESEGSEPCFWVRVVGGNAYKWIASAAEVQRRLEEVGLIAPQSAYMPDFTENELAELGACLADGYSYAAKDDGGRVYAFSEAPVKGKHSWINDDGISRVARLTAGQYAALSFENECPLDIAVALEGVHGC